MGSDLNKSDNDNSWETESAYFISLPENKKRIKYFRPRQPNKEIFPDIVLGMDGIHWIKFILGSMAYRNVDLSDESSLQEMVLNPEWGAYNRCLLWAFEVSDRNEETGSGFYVAKNWTYGTQARKSGRDFVSYEQFGDLLSDIVNTSEKEDLVKNWQLFFEENKTRGELKEFKERFENDVLGTNLPIFPIAKFLKEVRPKDVGELDSKRSYTERFVKAFLRIFRRMPPVQEKVESHSLLGSYVPFVRNQMGIITASDFKTLDIDLKDGLTDPASLEPTLSEKGYDAFLLLFLLRDTPLFWSFVIQTYLNSRGVDFESEFLNMREEITSADFENHLTELEELIQEYKSKFEISRNPEIVERIAAWWDFNQFEYFMEKLCWKAHSLFLEDKNVRDGLLEDYAYERYLTVAADFLKNYHSNHAFYAGYLNKESFREHLQYLDNIEPKRESLLNVVDENVPRDMTDISKGVMFVGHDPFRKWSRSILESLQEGR